MERRDGDHPLLHPSLTKKSWRPWHLVAWAGTFTRWPTVCPMPSAVAVSHTLLTPPSRRTHAMVPVGRADSTERRKGTCPGQ